LIVDKKMEELIFHWGLEGFGADIFRISEGGKERFVYRYSSMDMDENDDEVWRHGEVEYRSFEDYWKEFVSQEHWLHYHPIFVHKDYKPFIREFLNGINQGSLTKRELLKLRLWLGEIVNEN
jgi:hypothetical protein